MKKYQEIVESIQTKIMQNVYNSGEKLPSITSLTKTFNCSKGTAIKAYDVLISRHVVYSKPQSGYYVANDFFSHTLAATHYDLSTGNPRVDSLPIIDVKHSLNVAVELYSQYSLEMQLKGTPSLLSELSHYLENHGIYAKVDNLYFSQGVTQAMSILARMPFPNGKSAILIEEPTFSFTVDQLRQYGCQVLTIKRTKKGIDVKTLEHLFKHENIKFFYTIPRNHNPLGTYLPLSQRKRIVELSQKYDVYLVENDYFSESFFIPRYETLYYLSGSDHCIYLKSYSKILPYIRIGFAILPPELQPSYSKGMSRAYFESYYMPDLVSQATLETLIKSDIITNIATQVSDNIKDKITVYNKTISKWDPSLIHTYKLQSGNYGTFRIPLEIPVESFIHDLRKRGVLVKSNISGFYETKHFDNSIRICLARVDAVQLKAALDIIYTTVQERINT